MPTSQRKRQKGRMGVTTKNSLTRRKDNVGKWPIMVLMRKGRGKWWSEGRMGIGMRRINMMMAERDDGRK